MPAEIAQINGKSAMAYLGETPWHRLGTPMTGKPTVADALKAASLDWNVELEPMFLQNGHKVPKRRAVVRDVDGRILATVGSAYTVLQNSEAFGVLDEACKSFGAHIETAGALLNGSRCWMLCKLPEVLEPVPGDKIENYFLVVTGHDGRTIYSGRSTPTRVVCQNTLTMALRSSSSNVIKLHHTKSDLEQVELVATMVAELVNSFQESGRTFKKLAAKKLDLSEINAYIDEVLRINSELDEVTGVVARRRDEIRRLALAGAGAELAPNTAWTAYNAFTEYVDHVRTAKSTRTLKAADKSALFGPTAKLKVRALQLATAL